MARELRKHVAILEREIAELEQAAVTREKPGWEAIAIGGVISSPRPDPAWAGAIRQEASVCLNGQLRYPGSAVEMTRAELEQA